MEQLDPDEIVSDAQTELDKRRSRASTALEWFKFHQGMFRRTEAISELASEHGWSEERANIAISDLVDDIVDPVQQVIHPEEGKIVGIIEYHEYPEYGCYGYVDYHDVEGDRQRVVCSRCVEQSDTDLNVTHSTEGKNSTPEGASWEQQKELIKEHYANSHSIEPRSVTVGASLASGTTISGNKAFHAGNDGAGSGLDAETLNGETSSSLGQDFATEQGTATANIDNGKGSTSISLSNTYKHAAFYGVVTNDVDFDEHPNVGLNSWNRNANNNITGANLLVRVNDRSPNVEWYVSGVLV
jgi:hypothetical protein